MCERTSELKPSPYFQVQEVHRQMDECNKELESHKTKRLAARNEMIAMAQVKIFCLLFIFSLLVESDHSNIEISHEI